jgi:hypothetical protein
MKKVLFLCLCIIVLFSGCEVKKAEEVTNADKFANEYSVSDKNPFVYLSLNEVYDLLDHGTGIIFFGNSDCEVCGVGAEVLTDVLIKNKVKEAYYYNPRRIKEENSKKYKKLLSMIDESSDEEISFNLPCVLVVKDGYITSYNDELVELREEDNDLVIGKDIKKDLRNKYNKLIKDFKSSE